MRKVKITLTGEEVHNVGYRLFLLDEAEAKFVQCFDARNMKIAGKQAVVALLGGDDEKVRDFVEYIKSTPYENASVSSIEVEDYEGDIRTTDSFRNSFSTHQLFKIARTGVTMLEKQDETIGEIRQVGKKVDRVGEKVDRVSEKVDRVGEKVDRVGEKVDRVGEKVDRVGEKVDRVGQKVDSVGEKVDQSKTETVEEIRALRKDAKSYFKKRFDMLAEEVSEIKQALKREGILS